jgi:hypothetical protein
MQDIAQGNDTIQRSASSIVSENDALRQHIAMLKDALLLSTLRTNQQPGGLPGPGASDAQVIAAAAAAAPPQPGSPGQTGVAPSAE